MQCPGPSSLKSSRALLLAAALYAAALGALHAPVLRSPGQRVLGGAQVAGLMVWEAWWFGGAWKDSSRTPWHTTALMHPEGVRVGPHSPLAALLYWPAAKAAGPYAGLNAFALAAYLGAGLGMFLLALELTGHVPAALGAGLVFMFSQEALTQHRLGQFGQAFTGFVPLLFLGLRRLADGRPARAVLILGALGSGLATPYTAFAALVVGGPLYAAALRLRGEVRDPRGFLREAALAWGLAAAAGALLYWPVLAPLPGAIGGSESYSLSLLSFLDPPSWHPSAWVQALRRATSGFPDPRAQAAEHVLSRPGLALLATPEHLMGYFPVALLGLLAWGAWTRRARGQGAWGVLGAGAVLLALGPRLQAAYAPGAVPLPYMVFKAIPFASSLRAPARLIMLAWLAAAVFAAFAVRGLWDALVPRPRARAALLAALAACFSWELGLGEAGSWWTEVPRSGAYEFLRSDPRPGAVLELPAAIGPAGDVSIDVQPYMLAQPLHGRPLVLGRPPRHSWDSLRFCLNTDFVYEAVHPAVLRALYARPDLRGRLDELRAGGRAALARGGIAFVLLHGEAPLFSDEVVTDYRRLLDDVLGAPAFVDGRGIVVYPVAGPRP
ncbi:MAG: hypothetical protein HY928_09900 [Elusimicrobia bacterium]|nr:hypothetical protein [Elusimicrobiota bacterium]